MQVLYIIFIIILGLVIGSFLNVLVYRAKEDKLSTIFFSRSFCPKCNHLLTWYDLVPVLSYVSLKGKCRYCGDKISLQYPIVELVNALIFVILFLFYGFSLTFVFYVIVFSLLLVVSVHDILTQMTPEVFVWIVVGLTLLGSWYFGKISLPAAVIGALIGLGVPGILVLISREKWMGAGDIKIGLILGLLLGYPHAVLGLFLAFVIGAIVGIIFIKLRSKTMEDSLPFAPFLVTATFLALLYGEKITSWYMGSFVFGIGGM